MLVIAAGIALWQRPWAPGEEPASVEAIAFPLSCALEQDQETQGHEGRLRQREDYLSGAIKEAYEALQKVP